MSPARQAFAALDDGILEAASSRGLLRRAARDAAAGKSEVTGEDDTRVTLSVDGEAVVLPAAGLKAATCTCPATDLCRHVLVAVLALRSDALPCNEPFPRETEEGSGEARVPDPRSAPPVDMTSSDESAKAPEPGAPVSNASGGVPKTMSDVAREIAAVNPSEMARVFGRAALRKAEDLLSEIAASGQDIALDVTPAKVVITVPGHPPVHYPAGGGAAGMISKGEQGTAALKTRHAAALLAARRRFAGETIAGPEPRHPIIPASETGKRDLTPFLAEIRLALDDCARQALATAPEALQDRLFDLALSSRADALPRLSRLLLQVAADIERRRDRALGYEPLAALSVIAEAAALATALASRPDDPLLHGAVRAEPEPLGPLILAGYGLDVWRTASGSRGVTAYFREIWDDDAGSQTEAADQRTAGVPRRFTATLARPAAQDPGFTPAEAARNTPVFGHSLERLASSVFRLTDASVGADARLSIGKGARADILDGRWASTVGAAADSLAGQDDGGSDRQIEGRSERTLTFRTWQERLRQAALKGHLRPAPDLVAISDFGEPYFDPLEQTAMLPARDEAGAWAELQVEGSNERMAAIFERIDALRKTRSRIILSILPRVTFDQVRLLPLAFAVLPEAGEVAGGIISALQKGLRGRGAAGEEAASRAIGATGAHREGRLYALDLLPDLPFREDGKPRRSLASLLRSGQAQSAGDEAARERAAATRFRTGLAAVNTSERLVAAALDDALALCELGGRMRDTVRLARLGQSARRLVDVGLAPLGDALADLAAAWEGERAGALLRFVHLAMLYRTLDPRLPLLIELSSPSRGHWPLA